MQDRGQLFVTPCRRPRDECASEMCSFDEISVLLKWCSFSMGPSSPSLRNQPRHSTAAGAHFSYSRVPLRTRLNRGPGRLVAAVPLGLLWVEPGGRAITFCRCARHRWMAWQADGHPVSRLKSGAVKNCEAESFVPTSFHPRRRRRRRRRGGRNSKKCDLRVEVANRTRRLLSSIISLSNWNLELATPQDPSLTTPRFSAAQSGRLNAGSRKKQQHVKP